MVASLGYVGGCGDGQAGGYQVGGWVKAVVLEFGSAHAFLGRPLAEKSWVVVVGRVNEVKVIASL